MPANTLYFDYLAHNEIISDNEIQRKPAVLKLKKAGISYIAPEIAEIVNLVNKDMTFFK